MMQIRGSANVVYQSIATVIAGLLIAGAIVFSRSSYSLVNMPPTGIMERGGVMKMDNRTGEMTVCELYERAAASRVGSLRIQCKILAAEYP